MSHRKSPVVSLIALLVLAFAPPAYAFVCGNGIVEPGEQCDDGNVADGDDCSSACQFEPRCGNGSVESSEQCDDGNVADGDGCTATCQFEGCASGLSGAWNLSSFGMRMNLADDGNGSLHGAWYIPSAPLSQYSGSMTGTYSGVLVTMLSLGTSAPRTSCDVLSFPNASFGATTLTRVSTTYCGDGVTDSGEECDDGNFLNGDTCTLACTSVRCGNSLLEEGEGCDDGNLADGDGCSSECQPQSCGNQVVESGEECDDGNLIDGDGCTAQCRSQVCGNGMVESGEQCDDGNVADGDDCSSACHVEPRCGNGSVESSEQCDDGNVAEGDGCTATCQFEGCASGLSGAWNLSSFGMRMNLADDGNGSLHGAWYIPSAPLSQYSGSMTGTYSGVLVTMLSLGTSAPRTSCDVLFFPNGSLGAMTLTRVSATYCGDGVTDSGEECDDGNFLNGDTCTLACTSVRCGNFLLEEGEGCDDGNLADGDGCSSECQPQSCGNQVVESGEECDDGNLTNGDGCTAQCRSQVCGNGMVEPGEHCDDGNVADGDDCSSACQVEPRCGNGSVEGSEQCDDGNVADGDGCAATCQFEGCASGLSGTWNLSSFGMRMNLADDGNGGLHGAWYIPSAPLSQYSGSMTGTYSGVLVTMLSLGTSAPRTSCDVLFFPNGSLGAMTLTRVSATYCGDGVTDSGEECDDGNFLNGDTCGVSCARPRPNCGNDIVDPEEACDDGNGINGDGCDANCTLPGCGNSIIDPVEQCDDGNTADGDGCDHNCGLPGCPNGQMDVGEECDDGNLVDDDGCARNCRLPRCGNGIQETGEECDDADTESCDGCSAECGLEQDGDHDGVVETCDNCPSDYNPSQRDRDDNGVGDSCDLPVPVVTGSGTNTVTFDDSGSLGSLFFAAIQRITITYSTVTSDGITEFQTLEAPPGTVLDGSFRLSDLGAVFHLETTAGIAGSIEVCVTYDDTRLAAEEGELVLLHEEDGVLVDRTSSRDPDANVICATVTSFSRFGIAVPLDRATGLRASLRMDKTQIGYDRLKRLSSTLVVGTGRTLDPTVTGATLTILVGGNPVLTRVIPAEKWVADRRGKFQFSDRTGQQAYGITKASLAPSSSGNAQISIRGQGLDLRGVTGTKVDFRFDFGGVTFLGSSDCTVKGGADSAGMTCFQR